MRGFDLRFVSQKQKRSHIEREHNQRAGASLIDALNSVRDAR